MQTQTYLNEGLSVEELPRFGLWAHLWASFLTAQSTVSGGAICRQAGLGWVGS